MMKAGQWLKAKRSKYKHFYIDGTAVCGSETTPNISKKVWRYEYCRKCKNKKAEMEKYALINMQGLARRLVVALLASHYGAQPKIEIDNVIHDLFDEAQAKLDIDNLIPDTQLYKKYLGV
jgi:hypothetical protein